jgi:hypothetical protein
LIVQPFRSTGAAPGLNNSNHSPEVSLVRRGFCMISVMTTTASGSAQLFGAPGEPRSPRTMMPVDAHQLAGSAESASGRTRASERPTGAVTPLPGYQSTRSSSSPRSFVRISRSAALYSTIWLP